MIFFDEEIKETFLLIKLRYLPLFKAEIQNGSKYSVSLLLQAFITLKEGL